MDDALPADLRFTRVPAGDVTLHVAQAGPADGPLVILLHGFPEFWFGWRRQLRALAEAGWLVWAPDQRGYNLSDKPPRIADYRLDRLAGDVAALIAAAGRQQAAIVGHDWGGAVAWWLAAMRPECVSRLAILNVPHPLVLRRALRTSPRQMLRSWYMLMFQLPWLPEAMFRVGDGRDVIRGLRSSSRPGAFTEDELPRYRDAWRQPGAPRGMLNWYRALFRRPPPALASPRITVPTLLLWGERDKFIGPEFASASRDLCDRGELVTYPAATHWLALEEPAEVNRRLLEFLPG